MPMTTVANLPRATLTTAYEKAYFDWSLKNKEVFGQFVDWQAPIPEDGGGAATYDFPAFGALNPTDTVLPEDRDITPENIYDFNQTVSPYEYGRAAAVTKLARWQSRVNLPQQLARIMADDRINSIDRIIRRAVYGYGSSRPTNTFHIDDSVAMSSLSAASGADIITWAFITDLTMQAASMGIEPMDGSNFVSIIHPLLLRDLQNLADFKNVGYYQVPDIIYRGEVGMLAGVRFIVSRQAKIFWGAGAATTTAGSTTIATSAVPAGSNTIVVASASNIAVGDYLTIGTVETESVSPGANLEQVLVTAINSTTLTVRSLGTFKPDSNGKMSGLRFDHAVGEAVVETYNVAALPIIGKNSIMGVHGSSTGRYGKSGYTDGLDILGRFGYVWWYWYGGVARVDRNLILGKVATSKWTLGSN